MRRALAAALGAVLLCLVWAPADAQSLGQVFGRVNPSVVIIRTRERAVTAQGQAASESGVGSGVLISSDGKIFTAAHVAQLGALNVDAVLVGEALVTTPDIGAKVRELSGKEGTRGKEGNRRKAYPSLP